MGSSTAPHRRVVTLFFILCCSFFFLGVAHGQKTYPSVTGVARPNPEPAPPGDPFNPPVSGTDKSNTPACAEWTRTAGPDESMIITGVDFSSFNGSLQSGMDTRFTVYSGDSMREAKIQRLLDDRAAITLDKRTPNWS